MAAKELAIAVTGACGKVGREMVRAVVKQPTLKLVGALDITNVGREIGEIIGLEDQGIKITADMGDILTASPDVIIDFTNAKAAFPHIKDAISNGISVVSGSTGFSREEIEQLAQLCQEKAIGTVVAPNFAIGAVLMFRLCQEVAKWFDEGEIIELHNPMKLDAPSGTAIRTAELIHSEWQNRGRDHGVNLPGGEPALGDQKHGLPIHSVRLQGVVAHQEVLFGALGQTLSIRHDSYSRESFVPGVMMAVARVRTLGKFVFGLENLIF